MKLKIGILAILLIGMLTLSGCGNTEPMYPEEDPASEEDPMSPEDPMLESYEINNLEQDFEQFEEL
ncbi:MAG: hypothetical protein ACOCP4_01280 [Candidatus Woesearchaeota archaeon]